MNPHRCKTWFGALSVGGVLGAVSLVAYRLLAQYPPLDPSPLITQGANYLVATNDTTNDMNKDYKDYSDENWKEKLRELMSARDADQNYSGQQPNLMQVAAGHPFMKESPRTAFVKSKITAMG